MEGNRIIPILIILSLITLGVYFTQENVTNNLCTALIVNTIQLMLTILIAITLAKSLVVDFDLKNGYFKHSRYYRYMEKLHKNPYDPNVPENIKKIFYEESQIFDINEKMKYIKEKIEEEIKKEEEERKAASPKFEFAGLTIGIIITFILIFLVKKDYININEFIRLLILVLALVYIIGYRLYNKEHYFRSREIKEAT